MLFRNIIYIGIFFSVLCLGYFVTAQQPTKADLEKRRSSLLKEIELTQKQLEETKQNKNATLSDLKALQSKLATRQQLINTINSEITDLEQNIKASSVDIAALTNKLKAQQKSYAETIRYAYKTREAENFVAFLFSASDFNDALRRLQYLKKYNDLRKIEGERIVKTQASLNNKIQVLSNQKSAKNNLLSEEQSQTSALLAEKAETDKLINQLKGMEKELTARIKKDKATSIKLESSIKEMIRKEIALAKKKAEEEAARKRALEQAAIAKQKAEEEAKRKLAEEKANAGSQNVGLRTGSSMRGEQASGNAAAASTNTSTTTNTNSQTNDAKTLASNAKAPATPANKPIPVKPATTEASTSYKMSLTPDVQTISNNFVANQGRLPWPLEKGYISSQYGKQAHPVYATVTIDNLGIDITTTAGAPVRSVFEGTVTKISNIEGYIVMISHGEYFTIYSGLASVSVKQGDKVGIKQTLGTIGKNEDGVSVLNFQVWKVTDNNFSTVNPAGWIAR